MSDSVEENQYKQKRLDKEHSESPEPSSVSMKSDWSINRPITFEKENVSYDLRLKEENSESPEPSSVSMKSDWSINRPITFREEDGSSDLRPQKHVDETNISFKHQVESIFQELEHKVIGLLKNELKRFKKLLITNDQTCTEIMEEKEEVDQNSTQEGAMKMTLNVLKKMNQPDLATLLHNKLVSTYKQKKLKSKFKAKYKRINEKISQLESQSLLNEVFTDLYITEGCNDVNNEHEVRKLEKLSRKPLTEEKPVKCIDLFKDKSIKTVLTKGVAGIGKTFSVQKFILDWAEGKSHQEVNFIFPLPFRELSLIRREKLSLMDLLRHFFPEIKELKSINCDEYKVIFIFNALDEYRLPLDFQNNKILCDENEPASVDVLLTNLIKGNLLPSAFLWITSRPGAANRIPPEFVSQVTEIRGFTDPQKEEYFRKRITDQNLSNKIISHIKSTRSLHIMCQIPVFCWISAIVLKRLLGKGEAQEIPKTLTQMFTHFLIYQIKYNSQKYHKKDLHIQQTREGLLALGKLAFKQLERGKLIFFEEDLKECGIDVREAAVYSGVCNQIFNEEFDLYLGKRFSFIHISVQEYLAALFSFCSASDTNVGYSFFPFSLFSKMSTTEFLKSSVDKALQSKNGHLDLYLRFILGFSLESNQTLLQDLLPQTEMSFCKTEEIIQYIKLKISENLSTEQSINLLYCLNELNDQSLVQEVQTYLNKENLSGVNLSPAQWSALVFVLLNSDEKLDEFYLTKYDRSEYCLLNMRPVIQVATKVVLSRCNLTVESCEALSTILSSDSTKLKDLDLSSNKLGDSGVKRLSVGLQNPHCKLEKLGLYDCGLTEESCAELSSVLSLNSNRLKELNLSDNKLHDSGVKLLSKGLQSSQCKLEILWLAHCRFANAGFNALGLALKSNPSSMLKALHLYDNHPEGSGVNLLSELQKDPNYKLTTMRV